MDEVVQLLEYNIIFDFGFDLAADSTAQEPINESSDSIDV